jgi:transposase InsO family protein
VWVSDITYVRTAEGWLDVAAILDLSSRRIVGWATGASLAAELVLAALAMALRHRRPPAGLLYHRGGGGEKRGLAMGEPAIAASRMPVATSAPPSPAPGSSPA